MHTAAQLSKALDLHSLDPADPRYAAQGLMRQMLKACQAPLRAAESEDPGSYLHGIGLSGAAPDDHRDQFRVTQRIDSPCHKLLIWPFRFRKSLD